MREVCKDFCGLGLCGGEGDVDLWCDVQDGELDGPTALFTAEGPATAYRRAKEALEMMGGKMTEKEAYRLRAVVPVDLWQVRDTMTRGVVSHRG